jgi:phage shock protein A
MSIETKAAKQAIHEMLDARIKTVEASLEALKAKAEGAKAAAEIKLIAELAPRRIQLQRKFEELKNTGDANWEQAKKHLESLVVEFEKEIKKLAAKIHAH